MEPEILEVHIDEKKMRASLTMYGPEGEERQNISADFAEKFLNEHGVVAGIKRNVLEAFVIYAQFGQEVVVAEGIQPGKGIDGRYEYQVSVEDARQKPVVNEDGSVDYLNSLTLAMVDEGDLLAYYVPADFGEPGKNVLGEIIPPHKGRELPKLKGKGFTVDGDGKHYYASVSGRIFIDGDSLNVESVYVVKGDLSVDIGNIRFNGDVEVKGDVRSGLEIEADGSIFVHGHVGGCKLCAGSNITIRKGVQGREKCIITSGGDVACSFIERCVINAKGSVYADSILTSEIVAGNQVVVNSKKGHILGGTILGCRGVIAKTVGSASGTGTILEAGYSTEVVKRAAELAEEQISIKADLELLDQKLTRYNSLDENKRNAETESMRKKLFQAKIHRGAALKKTEDEMHAINELLHQIHKEGKVRIYNVAYPGLRVRIGKDWFELREASKDVTFTLRSDGVAMVPGEECEVPINNS